ncbi:TetR family transcriptional regulator [Ciceribacter naphthalenivorans]|uniref:TetR family transcriptional regulator n=3 Tax=Pseudomonadota TaxID=1224 RepID=A0A512HD23_9HYPH|nr:TetR family transcriptional regulator [Ciceribacter naphthalenivorans]GLR20257.1 TetR family transcriptional regulator [Ciceribacter naphthalenivorans]GLT03113.1 TetR family transcriptional regulator [Sphingomonas psychrolutea]
MARLSRAETMAITRNKLINSALQTFLKVGFSAATIDGIAEQAGFSRGAFYAHFSSKEQIFLEIIASQADDVTPKLIAKIEGASNASDAIEAVSRWAEERSQSQDLVVLMMEVMQLAKQNGTLDERYTRLFKKNWYAVGEALRPFFPEQRMPGSPEEIIAIIVALSYGPVVSGAGGFSSGRLVKLVLTAMMLPHSS